MLSEFKQVRQEPGTPPRRWFVDDGFELIVWLDKGNLPAGFQICYTGGDGREYALTWRERGGFQHARVDTGDTRPDKNLTPVLVADDAVPWPQVRATFVERSAALESGLRNFVQERLAEGGN